MRESSHWMDFPSRFKKATPQAEIELLDIPGSGRYWRMKSPCSIGDMVQSQRHQFLKALQRTQANDRGSAFLLSISLGGMIAIEWARQYPDDFSGLILINTSLGGINPFYRRITPAGFIRLFQIATMSNTLKREEHILQLTSNMFSHSKQTAMARAEVFRQHPVRKENLLRQIIAAVRFRYPKKPPSCALLLLSSRQDKMVHPSCSQAIKNHWGVELKTHATAGHDLPLDDPDWTIRSIRDWADRIVNKSAFVTQNIDCCYADKT